MRVVIGPHLPTFLFYFFFILDRKRALVSVNIWNETFLEEYKDPNSTDFQSLARPFCEAVSRSKKIN